MGKASGPKLIPQRIGRVPLPFTVTRDISRLLWRLGYRKAE